MEHEEGAVLPVSPDSSVSIPVHPYEIVTVRVEYPKNASLQ
jgi:hypothetical protein